MKFWFWFLWSIDAVIAAVALYFFFSLAAGGRVGSFNILPWLAILAALAAVVGGSIWLRSAGQHAVAIVLLLLLAIPRSAVHDVFPSAVDSPSEFSLSGRIRRSPRFSLAPKAPLMAAWGSAQEPVVFVNER